MQLCTSRTCTALWQTGPGKDDDRVLCPNAVPFTGITTFPEGLGVLRQLEGLQADGCHLQAPFNTLYDKDPLLLVKLHDTQLSTLDLSDAGLEVVPEQLNRMTQLTGLNLLRNSIKVNGCTVCCGWCQELLV